MKKKPARNKPRPKPKPKAYAFSESQMEWIQEIVGMCTVLFEMKAKPTICTSRVQYRSYFPEKKTRDCKVTYGASVPGTGFLFLDPEYHVNKPVRVMVHTIVHEMLHLAHPGATERDVRKMTGEIIPLGAG